jgi:Flp pilus assembly protein TadD
MRTIVIVGGVVLGGLVACQANRPHENPGALPTSKIDATPRLNASTYVAHGYLLEQQRELEPAATQYREALQLAPDLVTARNRLGITLNKLGRHGEASAQFRAAVEHNPSAAYLQNNLGFSLYLEGKHAEAEPPLARAVELQPTFRRAQMNHGLVLAKLERYDEALAAFCQAGTQTDAYYNLALLQTEDAHYADAARALQSALGLNPEFAEAREQLRAIARLAAAEEAEQAAQAAAAAAAEEAELAARAAAAAAEPDPASGLEDVALAADQGPDPCDGFDVDEAALSFDDLTGLTVDALGGFSLLPAHEVADLIADLKDVLATKMQWWQATLRRLADSFGLRDKPY